MRIVVDTNILFSFFWENSPTRKILLASDFELISPEIAIRELGKYSQDIVRKTNKTIKQFNLELLNLQKIIKFMDKKQYLNFLNEANKIAPDKDDSDFLALSLKFNCLLWSNDSSLKKQDKIKVLSTEEIIELLF